METMSLCPWEAPTYFIMSPNAYPLFYYAHFVPLLFGAILVGALLWRNPRSLALRILATLFSVTAAWILTDLLATATNRPDVVVFLWSVIVLIEPLTYVAAFFFFYAFAFDRLPSFKDHLVITTVLTPLILLAPTAYNIPGVYVADCTAEEGFLASHYSYGVEILMTLWILFLATETIARARGEERNKILLCLLGLLAFLIAFASGNLIGTFTGDWVTAQYGLFGLPVFIGFLGYLVVRYRVFNVKVLGTQVLVVALALLVLSLIFVESLEWVLIIASGTFALVCALGWFLVRSVQKEIEQRELIEKQEKELELVNQQQESLLHFVSHEVKGYLTEGQNAFAGIVEGDFGAAPEKITSISKTALGKMRTGVSTVMDILDAANLKKGTMQYKHESFDFRTSVEEVLVTLQASASEKGLTLNTHIDEGSYSYTGDVDKLKRHVIRNLIDNAIRYTPQGAIEISLRKLASALRFSVNDNGIGITPEDMKRLFTEGGHGKESIKTNVNSTGYGLFVAKSVVTAHGGKIWAESEGEGKGSTFVVELPLTT
jgi:signal transduction histidine kinase